VSQIIEVGIGSYTYSLNSRPCKRHTVPRLFKAARSRGQRDVHPKILGRRCDFFTVGRGAVFGRTIAPGRRRRIGPAGATIAPITEVPACPSSHSPPTNSAAQGGRDARRRCFWCLEAVYRRPRRASSRSSRATWAGPQPRAVVRGGLRRRHRARRRSSRHVRRPKGDLVPRDPAGVLRDPRSDHLNARATTVARSTAR